MKLVVDASVAVKWFVRAGEPEWELAERLLVAPYRLLAPDLVVAEVANTLRKLLRRGLISRAGADAAAANVGRYFHELRPLAPLLPQAWTWAVAHDHPVYDCMYAALARQEDARLVTADRKLANLAITAGLGARVCTLADVASG